MKTHAKSKSTRNWIKLLMIATAVAALMIGAQFFHIETYFKHLLTRINGLGAWGPLLFVAIYIVATILFIPGSILTLGAGVIFGVVKGAIVVSTAATLGAASSFLIGR